MKLKQLEQKAKRLMTQHGVGHLRFGFDNGKRRIAATHFIRAGHIIVPERITVSRHFAAILTERELHDTILHEIAHAIAGHEAGHGPVWRTAVRKIGGKAERCKVPSATLDKAVKGTCPNCGQTVAQQHRLPLRVYWHTACGRYPLTWTKNGATLSLREMPQRYQTEYMRSFQ